jgi:hypothetical protein
MSDAVYFCQKAMPSRRLCAKILGNNDAVARGLHVPALESDANAAVIRRMGVNYGNDIGNHLLREAANDNGRSGEPR